jgi:hypothetical protein
MMPTLPLEDRFAGHADDVYERLVRAHDGLTDADSAALNIRLVLILANALGEVDLLQQAIDLARRSLVPPGAAEDVRP